MKANSVTCSVLAFLKYSVTNNAENRPGRSTKKWIMIQKEMYNDPQRKYGVYRDPWDVSMLGSRYVLLDSRSMRKSDPRIAALSWIASSKDRYFTTIGTIGTGRYTYRVYRDIALHGINH